MMETEKKNLWFSENNKSLISLKRSHRYQRVRLTENWQRLYHSNLMWNWDRMTAVERNIISEVVYP